jgi:hypothetical protein
MSEMKELDKLRVLLPHWIDHNHSHIAEFEKWRGVAASEGNPAQAGLAEAVAAMTRAGEALSRVLAELGGPLAPPGQAHHHHHHHHD